MLTIGVISPDLFPTLFPTNATSGFIAVEKRGLQERGAAAWWSNTCTREWARPAGMLNDMLGRPQTLANIRKQALDQGRNLVRPRAAVRLIAGKVS